MWKTSFIHESVRFSGWKIKAFILVRMNVLWDFSADLIMIYERTNGI